MQRFCPARAESRNLENAGRSSYSPQHLGFQRFNAEPLFFAGAIPGGAGLNDSLSVLKLYEKKIDY